MIRLPIEDLNNVNTELGIYIFNHLSIYLSTDNLIFIFNTINTVLDAVRSALLTMFCGLPVGCIIMDEKDYNIDDYASSITDATGWNNILEQAWIGAVNDSTNPTSLMECLLLLEYYIKKEWMLLPASKLLNALPNPHFSMRLFFLFNISI